MRIRIVRYDATNSGVAVPANIEVEIEEEGRPWTSEAMVDVIGALVDRIAGKTVTQAPASSFEAVDAGSLATPPSAWESAGHTPRTLTGADLNPGPALRSNLDPQCRRTLCGHPQSGHKEVDDQGQEVGHGYGMCAECGNPDRCRSFVGPLIDRYEPKRYTGTVARTLILRGMPIAADRSKLADVDAIGPAAREPFKMPPVAGADLYPGQPVTFLPLTREWRPKPYGPEEDRCRRDGNKYTAGMPIRAGDQVGFRDGEPMLLPMHPVDTKVDEVLTLAGFAVDDIAAGDRVADFRVLGPMAMGLWRNLTEIDKTEQVGAAK